MGFLTGKSDTKKAAAADLTGFNYLKDSPLASSYGATGAAANTDIANLLGVNGEAAGAQSAPAFQNYLNSTGYKFQLQSGSDAITGNMAARGLVNSGATAKSLEEFGQNLGATSFQNYLGNLGGLSAAGQNAYNTIGSSGTSGGQAAGNAWNQQAGEQAGLFGSIIGTGLGFIPGAKKV